MLKVTDVAKSYGGETILHISFVLNPGERFGLIGPNGAGKSTLLKIIAGIEPPDHGTVRLDLPIASAISRRRSICRPNARWGRHSRTRSAPPLMPWRRSNG